MKSVSEKSYGARVGKAEKLATALNSMTEYRPLAAGNSAEDANLLIAEVKGLNTEVVYAKQNNSMAIENRKRLFEKNPYSINKVLASINSTVKAIFGRNSKEAQDVAALISKMRGHRPKTGKGMDKESISRSYRSYDSTVQYFSDLTAMLANFGERYEPADPNLATDKLTALYAKAVEANKQVMDTFNLLLQRNTERIALYGQLSELCSRIKDNVKGQYGAQSVEYRMVKSLDI